MGARRVRPCNDGGVAAPTRVLLVVSHGGAGGMQVQVGLLATTLARHGVEVAVACGPGDLAPDGVERLDLPALGVPTAMRVAATLRGHVERWRPSIVHGHGLRLAPVVARAARATALVTCHGLDPARARRTAALVRWSRTPIAACGEGPRRLLASHGVMSGVLDNAVPALPPPVSRSDLASRFELDPSHLLVLSPARLSPQKDPVTLVRAVARTAGVSAVLVGGGPLAGSVRDEIARLGVTDRVHVTEWLPDARALLGGADVVSLASVWEGQPTVVLEAMAAGVAVVATACVGTADTVVDGVTGLLAPPRDPDALASALTRATDGALRERLVRTASATVPNHRPDVVAAAHLAAYERVLEGRWPSVTR